MSSYVNFYVRSKSTGAVISIADYSRSTAMYEQFSAILPYGKARILDARDFEDVKMQIKNSIASINRYIDGIREYISTLTPGATAATYEAYREDMLCQLGCISESKESIEELNRALVEVDFIQNITYDTDTEVLAGIEVEWDEDGNRPITIDDTTELKA